MSAATLAFGEPPLASPELALVDAALAAELRRSLPDRMTQPAPESRVEQLAALTVVGEPPGLRTEPEPECEPDSEPEREPEAAVEPSAPEVSGISADLAADTIVEAPEPGSCDDLIVGYHDEQPVAATDPEGDPSPELPEVPEPPAAEAATTDPELETDRTEDEAAPTHAWDDLSVVDGERAEAPVSAYPTLPVPDDDVDSAGDTDTALRNIQHRLTTDGPDGRKRRFRRRFTFMSGVVGVSALVALTAQMYAGIAS